jgi:hypothetical protein
MLRQLSSRSHRSKKLRASHGFQAFLLVAVAVWIVYQLTHPFGERRRHVAVEETSGSGSNDAEPARRRLRRMGFVRFPGHASVDDNGIAAGARSWSGGSSDDDLSGKAGDGEGGEEGPEADGDDADDGLAVAADEEDDGMDFQSRDGRRDDDPKAVHGGTHQNGLNISGVAKVNGTGTVLDGAAVLLPEATGGAADGTALTLTASAKNDSSVVGTALLRGTGSAGELLANSFAVGAPGAEKPANNTQKAGTYR